MTQTVGNVAALVHSVTGDEVLKNLYTDYSVETYEIAAYTSLIALAEEAGHGRDIEILRLSLKEEERMAEAVFAQIVPVTKGSSPGSPGREGGPVGRTALERFTIALQSRTPSQSLSCRGFSAPNR